MAGAVEYDAKGRAASGGQPYFVNGTGVAALLAHKMELKNPTVKEYDGLDRVTKVTLPDGSAQTIEYGIQGGRSYEMAADALGNVSTVYRDGRSNTIRVEKRDKEQALMTSGTFAYNVSAVNDVWGR